MRTSRSCGLVSRSDGEGLEEPRVVLVRPGPGRVEDDRLALLVPDREHRVVDGVRHDVDAARVEVEELDGAFTHELARHDDGRRTARRPVVRDAPERLARRAEELGEVAVLRVVQRDDGRRLRPRRRHGERVVEDVELGDVCGDGFRPTRCERHRGDPQRPAPADAEDP